MLQKINNMFLSSPLHIILFRIAATCLVILIAMGIDNLIFHLVDASSTAAMFVATVGFVALFAGIVLSIWFDDYYV